MCWIYLVNITAKLPVLLVIVVGGSGKNLTTTETFDKSYLDKVKVKHEYEDTYSMYRACRKGKNI